MRLLPKSFPLEKLCTLTSKNCSVITLWRYFLCLHALEAGWLCCGKRQTNVTVASFLTLIPFFDPLIQVWHPSYLIRYYNNSTQRYYLEKLKVLVLIIIVAEKLPGEETTDDTTFTFGLVASLIFFLMVMLFSFRWTCDLIPTVNQALCTSKCARYNERNEGWKPGHVHKFCWNYAGLRW